MKMLQLLNNKSQMAVLLFLVITAAQETTREELENWTFCNNSVYILPEPTPVYKSQHKLFLHVQNVGDIICKITSNLTKEQCEEVYNKTSDMLQRVKQSLKPLTHYYTTLELTHLQSLLTAKQEFFETLHNFSQEMTYLKVFMPPDNEEIRWDTLQAYADKLTLELEYLEQDEQTHTLLQHYIRPAFQGIIFITGLLGNGVLLAIFLKHKEMWTPTNIMLLNLAVADIYSLVVNLPMYYMYSSSTTWEFGEVTCKLFRFTRHLGIGVSVFSVVALSILRYCATVQSSRGKQLKYQLAKFLVLCVWIMACLFALPHTIFAHVYENKCYNSGIDNEFYKPVITLFEFLVVCILPITIIIILTILTACKLSLTINNTAKEGRRAIRRVSKILVGLTIVFSISYVPFYLYRLLFVWYEVLELGSMAHSILLFVLYTLLFSNACFNPVALYIVSHTFRYYFHKYLFQCCGQLEDSNNTDLTSYAEDVSHISIPI